jgi:hypothetical protein
LRGSDEPADRDINLGLAHQLPIMHDADEQTGGHQPYRYLGIDPGPTITNTITVGNFFPEPG